MDRRLCHLEDFHRDETAGKSAKIKAGHYRLGDQRVKHLVHWPHKFCSVGYNFQLVCLTPPSTGWEVSSNYSLQHIERTY